MRRSQILLATTIAAELLLATACGRTKSPREATQQAGYDTLAHARAVDIRQKATGCEPVSIKVKSGETIQLRISNQTDLEYRLAVLEGGRPYNDLIVPAGEKSSTYYDVAPSGPTSKLLCYVQGGVSTTIEFLTE